MFALTTCTDVKYFNRPLLVARTNYYIKGQLVEICKGSSHVCGPSEIERFPLFILSDQSFPALAQLRCSLISTYVRLMFKQ